MPKVSSTKFIARRRTEPLRVRLVHREETVGGFRSVELPFVIGVLADLTGSQGPPQPAVEHRKMLEIDVDNFDHRMKALAPSVEFSVPNALLGSGSLLVSLTFNCMDDFRPDAVARNIPALTSLLETRRRLEAPSTEVVSNANGQISAIDRALEAQLNLVLHHANFRHLEGAWRGLYYLVNNVETDTMPQIRVINLSKAELSNVLKHNPWDGSPLFRKLYSQEFKQLGGVPYGCVIGDYEFDHSPVDIEILANMARIAALAHTPFIAGGSPTLVGLTSWRWLPDLQRIGAIFSTDEYAAWRSFRNYEDSRYIVLTLPRFLARLPYGKSVYPVDGLAFEETVYGPADDNNFLWANAAYALGVNIARAFKQHGWCARIQGFESGGSIEGLPHHPLEPVASRGRSTETWISDLQEVELQRCGLAGLVARHAEEGTACYFSAPSVHEPATYVTAEAAATAALSSQLPYILVTSRIAQLLKLLERDRLGAHASREQREQRLNDWLMEYVLPDPDLHDEETRCRKPLREARISLEELPGHPGKVLGRLIVNPHYLIYPAPLPLEVPIHFDAV